MSTLHRMRKRAQRGQSLVEFSLVLPIILIIFMAIFDFGRVIFMYSQVGNGAREGARFGSVTGLTQSSPQFLDCGGIRAAAQRGYGLSLTPDQIEIEYDNGGTEVYTFTCDDNPPLDFLERGDRVRVTITAEFSFITPLLSAVPPYQISLTSARTLLRGGTQVPSAPG